MPSPFGRPCLVVNPHAGGRGSRGRLRRITAALDAQGLEHDVELTAAPGDAVRITRRLVEGGCRFVVAVGGDGTVHEVVNGLLDDAGRPVADDAVLGVVAAGSGSDYIRSLDIPSGAEAAVARLGGDRVRRVDAARIRYTDGDGREATRCFANIAEVGLGASTAVRAERLPRRLGQSRYLAAFWAVLPSYRVGTARVEVDGELAYEGRAVNVVVANARYFGGGMHISPRSRPDDGVLELLVLRGRKTDSFTMLAKVYRGRHLPDPGIVELSGRSFQVESEGSLDVEADGEVLGSAPVTVDVLPGALTLKV